jgi:hypothetical protein
MTTFTGGPADGKAMRLRRSPLFLRVAFTGDGIRVLDRLGDNPLVGEGVACYRRLTVVAAHSRYDLSDEQPCDATMRYERNWQAWCMRMSREHDPVLT